MGEAAEMLLDGTCCAGCGEYMHSEGDGIPRYCSACGGGPEKGEIKARRRGRKRERNKRRRAKIRQARKEALNAADTTGWEKKSDYHFQCTRGADRIDWWPSTGKWCINDTPQNKPIDEFLKGANNGNS